MSDKQPSYSREKAPVIGFLMTTIETEFDNNLKEKVKNIYKDMFEDFRKQGIIHSDSMFFDYCYEEKDIYKACEIMLDKRVEGIIYHPLTWPTSDTIFAVATYRYLKNIPLFVSASPEIFPEGTKYPANWPLNSNCGKIFAKSIFYKMDRKNLWAVGKPDDPQYRKRVTDFFTICSLISRINVSKIAVIGNILDDFPESFYNPVTVRREVGARIMEIDTSVLFSLYEEGEYPSRDLKINEQEIHNHVQSVKNALKINTSDETLEKGARAYLAYKAIIQSVGAEGAVFRCAPEWEEKHGIAVCGVESDLIDNNIIFSAGCEGDVLNCVGGLLQYYASGKTTTCLDWIDAPGASGEGVYNLLHCGNACKGMLIPNTGVADYHQAWTDKPYGYTIEGPIKNGAVTVVRLRENRESKLEMLIIEGESVAKEMKIRGNYGLVHFGRERLQTLVNEIDSNGWPHHLSLGWGHHGDILEKAVTFMGDIKVIRI